MSLRDYQKKAVDAVLTHWSAGRISVCLVAPTGSGKTRMGEELIAEPEPSIWVAHRRELITQTAERLRARFGRATVGTIMPGEYETPKARIQVATVQTLLARDKWPAARRVVFDEAHHYMAEDWSRVDARYPGALKVGLTATPERKDGEPLGDMFGELVVAASYSELIAGQYLVPARVYRPATSLGNDLAQDPVDAWIAYSEGSRAFVFAGRVADAYSWAQRFRDAGVLADVIAAGTPKRERDEILERFVRGQLRVLVNVNTMTEGVDVPEARTIILGRRFGHVGAYLQAVGRGLRPAKDKPDMILIDLVGASCQHGLPTLDRKYSLAGRPISPGPGGGGPGGVAEYSQEVKGTELRMVARGALPPDGEVGKPQPAAVDDKERRAEFDRLVALAKQSRMRPEFASARYRAKFGEWPLQEWSRS